MNYIIHPFIHSFIRSFVHSFIHLLTRWLVQNLKLTAIMSYIDLFNTTLVDEHHTLINVLLLESLG